VMDSFLLFCPFLGFSTLLLSSRDSPPFSQRDLSPLTSFPFFPFVLRTHPGTLLSPFRSPKQSKERADENFLSFHSLLFSTFAIFTFFPLMNRRTRAFVTTKTFLADQGLFSSVYCFVKAIVRGRHNLFVFGVHRTLARQFFRKPGQIPLPPSFFEPDTLSLFLSQPPTYFVFFPSPFSVQTD